MPRRVVPILPAPLASSRSASRSRWNGRISAQLSAMRSVSGVATTPCSPSRSISALQRPGIEHDAVADHRRRAADDARGQQRQLVDLVADDQRVAGIVPALEAHDHVGALGEPVDDLALALVAPLRADHRYVGHDMILACRANPRDLRRTRRAGGSTRMRGAPSGPAQRMSIVQRGPRHRSRDACQLRLGRVAAVQRRDGDPACGAHRAPRLRAGVPSGRNSRRRSRRSPAPSSASA